MTVITGSQENFQKEVSDAKGIVFVDFFAEWCGPCKITSPIIDQLSEEKNNMKFIKIDVDKNPELVSQYQIFSIPTFVIFKDGKMISQFVGAHSKEGFEQEIKKATS